jgi:predicted MFS family arabinose efflux permease
MLVAGLLIFALTFGNFPAALAAGTLWGLGSFSSNSLQQSRLVGLAPSLAAATVALNTSVVYLGQAIGAGAGGIAMDSGMMAATGWIAVAFMALALLLSLTATRLAAAQKP